MVLFVINSLMVKKIPHYISDNFRMARFMRYHVIYMFAMEGEEEETEQQNNSE